MSQSEIENVGGGREDSEDRGKLAASVGTERSSSDRPCDERTKEPHQVDRGQLANGVRKVAACRSTRRIRRQC